MGQQISTEGPQEALNEVEAGLAKEPPSRGIKLYRFVRVGDTGKWEVESGNAQPRFYDAKEDSGTGDGKDWFMEVDGGDIDARVDEDLGFVLSMPELRVTFTANGVCWALRFPEMDMFRSFAEELNDKSFYNLYGKDNDEKNRAKELGDDYAHMFFAADVHERLAEPMDLEPDADNYRTPERAMKDDAPLAAQEDGDEEGENIGLLMGAGDNNFLMRGKNIQVLRNVDGGVETTDRAFNLTPLTGGRGTRGKTPAKVLLANSERTMNLLTPDHPDKLLRADIETGRVVSTWAFQKDDVDIPMLDIAHDDKTGQMDSRTTFLGLDKNRLCKWDLRDPRGVVNSTPVVQYCPGGKDYSRNTNFTCMASSGDGYVAVGSKDGKVRLYNGASLSLAKTAVPGLGPAITAIDVTYDGKWVLATTERALMVIKTTFEDDKGRVSNGFTSRMGGRGAMPRLLRLKPEDQMRAGGKPLTNGKFTWITEAGQQERWVQASCGPMTILWNFTRIKSTGMTAVSHGGMPTSMDYTISMKDEDVVDAAFQHTRYARNQAVEQANLLVATPHRLFNMG